MNGEVMDGLAPPPAVDPGVEGAQRPSGAVDYRAGRGARPARAERAPASWPDLLASALVGTARAGGDAEALLEAAAEQALRRRAGVALVPAGPLPPPAPAAEAPMVGRAAAARADALLALDQPAHNTTPVRDLASRLELLAEWLAAAAAAGRRLPPELVPSLLDAGRRHRQLRPLIGPVAGPLAGWLAAQRPDWSYASAAPPVESTIDEEAWEFGTITRRVGYLRRLRRHDPGRARELLEAVWEAEPPEHRATLLPALGTGLSAADEPLLERALDDRRRAVRDAALDLFPHLSGSGYARRMAAMARECVELHERRIVVHPPAACDRTMRRDGIAPRPPAGTGERAWWLEEILARTPLDVWPEPRAFLARAVDGNWAPTLRRGLARAAAAQRDGAWAAALVDPLTEDVAAHGRPDDRLLLEALYEALPADDLAGKATAALGRGLSGARAVGVEQVLALCPRPWPPAVVETVLGVLADQLGRPVTGWRTTGLCELAALGFPAATAPRVWALVERLRADRPIDPGLAAAERLAATLRFRYDMLRELASDD